jgi:protein transport protein SEC24
MPPVYFFVIDVSVTAVNSGMLATTAAAIKSCLDNLPGADRTRIGFLTYDQHLHFYSLKASLTQPQMMASLYFSIP